MYFYFTILNNEKEEFESVCMCEREKQRATWLEKQASLDPPHSVPSQQKIDTSCLAFEDMECHIYCNFNVWATYNSTVSMWT